MLQKQPTKAQKRRQHQADREAEREAELEAERAEQGESEKSIEDRELKEMLTPLGLSVRVIQVWQLISCWPHCFHCFLAHCFVGIYQEAMGYESVSPEMKTAFDAKSQRLHNFADHPIIALRVCSNAHAGCLAIFVSVSMTGSLLMQKCCLCCFWV